MNRTAALALTLLFAAGCAGDSPTALTPSRGPAVSLDESGPGALDALTPVALAQLAQVRRATARFHDISAAMAAGYTAWGPPPESNACMSNATGSMGHHLINPLLEDGNALADPSNPADPAAADPNIDMLHPERLLYSKRADGSLQLVGVEYLVLGAAWNAHHDTGPVLFGHPFVHSVMGHPGLEVEHYELHVWLWTSNPNGMFAQFDPNVNC